MDPQPEPNLPPTEPEPEISPVDEKGAISQRMWIGGIIAAVVLVATAAVGGYWLATQRANPVPTPEPTVSPAPEGVACTLEAKLCPDGSYVGRTGSNCEFTPCPSPNASPTPTPISLATPTPKPFASWKTYTNGQYGFSIMYPAEYKTLTSKDELSGWPNSVALLYNGGQAYDIVIQVWDKEEDYQLAYPQAGNELTVNLIKGKYVTVLDATLEPNNSAVIATFTAL